mmetsp:Transcript_125562/g.280473  ORF Transcript_125562/g.280473 Transcript_125562/m.280473 type:complete len:252 (+) Transcript_125562:406-1161(+)
MSSMRPRRPALIAFRAVLPVVVEAIRTTPVAISPFRVVRGRRRRGPWRRGPWRRGPWCLLRRGPAAGAARSLPQVGSLLKLWLRNGLPVALEALKFAGEVVGRAEGTHPIAFAPLLCTGTGGVFAPLLCTGYRRRRRCLCSPGRRSTSPLQSLGRRRWRRRHVGRLVRLFGQPENGRFCLFDQVQDASELEAHFAGDLVCVLYQGATIIAPLPTNHFEQVLQPRLQIRHVLCGQLCYQHAATMACKLAPKS